MYSNGFRNMVIFTHNINTSLEGNYENDGDVFYLKTLFISYDANVCLKKSRNQIVLKLYVLFNLCN